MNESIERQPRHYLLIDFEATCADDGSVPRQQMEIIEIGAVMVDTASLAVVGEFQRFVRPVRHPRLTAFCTGLTSIAQADVDAAPGFAEAAAALKAWRGGYADLAWGSWGDYDRNQLQQDCGFHRVSDPVGAPHHNIKRLFAQREGSGRKFGLDGAVARVRLEFAGTHHRGIDDARNIARLLPYALGRAEFPRARR
ncbi:exonuclease domain-containing protein [Lysobacter enzymogenes]|uniref:exonuclease domain-containing protein n=1 Tax=Lysobacter enzymogenes TaxID=69 RepID=UPI003749B2F8